MMSYVLAIIISLLVLAWLFWLALYYSHCFTLSA